MAISIETLALAKKYAGSGGGGSTITVDSQLSDSSTNPVQNKVVKEAIDAKYTKPQNGIPAEDLADGVIPTVPSTASDIGAVASNQGSGNSNKWLKVRNDGVVIPDNLPFNPDSKEIEMTQKVGMDSNGRLWTASGTLSTIELSDAIKEALLQIAQKVLYVDAYGQNYYNALHDALYPYVYYTVTNALTGCTTSNESSVAIENNSYSATITASSGHTLEDANVSITMGGIDITSSAYNNGTISIAAVTGNIVITIEAPEGIVLPAGYRQVKWVSNEYPNAAGDFTKPSITMPLDDILEIQFYKAGTGGGGQAITSDIGQNTCIGLYSNGIYYDLNGARAGFLSIENSGLYKLQFGNHYVENIVTGTSKTNTTQSGLGNVTWSFATNTPGNTSQEMNFARIRQIHNGTVVKDYIPCVDESVERAGYYDIINDQAYIGGRAFTYEELST